MKKQWTTVLDFIQHGKVTSKYQIVEVQGMNTVGDGGAVTLVRTGAVGTPSQSFTDTGNNTCVDKNGDVWGLQEGTVVNYNGSNNWFGNGFGLQTVGNYELKAGSWGQAETRISKGGYAEGIVLDTASTYVMYNGETYFATNPPYTLTATTPDMDDNLFSGDYTTVEKVVSKLGNTNLLSNPNFLVPSPEDINHPSTTSESYVADTQIFSGVYAGSNGCTLTYINGRVKCLSGEYQFRIPNTNGLEYVPVFTPSVASYDGIPITTGVSASYFGDYYLVTVTPEAGDVFSVKFEQGEEATRHEVGFATKKQFHSIASMISGASVGDKCSSGSTDWKRISSDNGDLSDFIALNGVWSKDFGVQAVDTYDSTTELQECIDSVSDNSTVHIEHPCSFGKITVSKSLSIKGFRANKNNSLIKLVGANAGFVSSGRIIELNYQSMYYECDGDLATRQIPQSIGAGSDIDEISYKNCYAKNCVVGLSMAFESGRVLRKKGVIEGCEIDTTVGVDSGEGYGLHCANDRQVHGYKSKIHINKNLVDKATRHSIYASRSGGYVITKNHVKNHRMSVFDGNVRPAILVGRASETVGYGNTYEDCYGVCLAIVPETVDGVTYDCTSVHFNNETFVNPKELAPVAFGLSARNGGDIIGASVRNSTFRMNDNAIPILLSYYGFDLNFQGNDIVYRGVGAVDLFVMVGVDESNYSTLHSDRWDFSRNNIDIYSKAGSINSYKITQNIGTRINLDNEIIGGDTTLTLSDPSMNQNRITLNGTRFLSIGISDPVGNITPYKIGERLVLLAPDPDTVWLAVGDTNSDWIKLG